jgi:alkyl hydroperoxide reductase subunit AhpC
MNYAHENKGANFRCVFFNEVYAKDSLKPPKVKTLKYYVYRYLKNTATEINTIQNDEVTFLATTVVLMKQQSCESVCSHREWQKIKCPKQTLKTILFQLK